MTRWRGDPATKPVKLTFSAVQDTLDELRALAREDDLSVPALIREAVYIHVHRLKSRSDPKLRRKSVCWGCGKAMDAASDGTKRAGKPTGRKKSR